MISKHLSENVKKVLRQHKDARNSDQDLYKYFMVTFFPDAIIKHDGKMFVLVDDDLPQQQDLARCRRKIQAKGISKALKSVHTARMRKARMAHRVLEEIDLALSKKLKNKVVTPK